MLFDRFKTIKYSFDSKYSPNTNSDYKSNTNNSTIFNSVKFYFPSYIQNSFHSILALSESNEVISHSNSFIHDTGIPHNDAYDTVHGTYVYHRLNITKEYLLNAIPDEYVDGNYYFLVNPFNLTNFGHDLSITLDRIDYYIKNNFDIPLVLPELVKTLPRILEVVQLLLPDISILFIKSDVVYKFTGNCYFSYNEIFNIEKHEYLIKRLVGNIVLDNAEQYKNKKVCLIKNNRNKYVIMNHNCYIADNFLNSLESRGWIILNPEHTSIKEIAAYLYYSSKILTSFGGISYGNGVFFNKNATIYHLLMPNEMPYKYIRVDFPINVYSNNLDNQIDNIINRVES